MLSTFRWESELLLPICLEGCSLLFRCLAPITLGITKWRKKLAMGLPIQKLAVESPPSLGAFRELIELVFESGEISGPGVPQSRGAVLDCNLIGRRYFCCVLVANRSPTCFIHPWQGGLELLLEEIRHIDFHHLQEGSIETFHSIRYCSLTQTTPILTRQLLKHFFPVGLV